MDADDDADAKEAGIKWSSIRNITTTKKSNGDYFLDIDCSIVDEDGKNSGSRVSFYVSPGRQDKVKDALLYLDKYPLTNLKEIGALHERYEALVAQEKDAETAANKENWKNYLRSKFSSVNDAVTYLNNNLGWAYTKDNRYYLELSFTASKATITFKNYDESSKKVGSYAGEKSLYWSDLDEAQEYTPGAIGWASESDCFKITAKNNRAIGMDGTSTLRLFWKTTYKGQWERIQYAFLYLKEFAN